VIGFLQNDASTKDDRANRQAQEYAFRAMGQRISGAARAGYDRGDAFRNWSELNTLALAAENGGDPAAARRYLAVAERLIQLSPLLSEAYFDPETGEANIAKYEADSYLVNVTGLAERSATWFAVKQAWDEKANTYVVHLTILAVSLFLLGLATTISGRSRWIFVIAGLIIALIATVWGAMVYLEPVRRLPDAAIDAFAQGVGFSHQGDYTKAMAAFDQALAQAPDYANAQFERGTVYYSLGDYQAAVTDFEAARMSGRDDASVAWNLAWLYYLQGRFDESIQTNRRTLEKDPGLLEAHFDLALAQLVSGQIDAARAEYAQTLIQAAEQVAQAKAAGQQPPASLWWSLDEAAASLDGLLDRIDGFEESWWSETPPLEKISRPEEVYAAAQEILAQIKGTSLALEYTGSPQTGDLTAQVTPFTFAQAEYDEEGNFVDYSPTDSFPVGTDEVLIVFDYEGMQDGQEVVLKVYYNGEEDISWRTVEAWSLGTAGTAEFPLSYAYSNVYTLASGEYLVEMYVDTHLAQRGYFVIEEDAAVSE
jgi:tetratricopeptide (TPR) repeat protein